MSTIENFPFALTEVSELSKRLAGFEEPIQDLRNMNAALAVLTSALWDKECETTEYKAAWYLSERMGEHVEQLERVWDLATEAARQGRKP